MAVIPRPFISWQIGQSQGFSLANYLDSSPSASSGQGTISLHQENSDLIIKDTRKPTAIIRFSPTNINPAYAASLIHLFKEAIGINLTETTPQQNCFLPILFTQQSPYQIALFGYSTPERTPLHRWRWALLNDASNTCTSLPIDDPQKQCFLEVLHLSGLRSLSLQERNAKLNIQLEPNSNGQIQGVDVKFNRRDTDCKDVLAQYLTDPSNPNHLKALEYLGLSPEQIKVLCSDEEIKHFKNLALSLKTLPEEKSAGIIKNLKVFYPSLFQDLWTEILKAKKAEQQEDNTYPKFLDHLQKQVSGQDYATKAVAAALSAQHTTDTNAFLLLVGPTGVGKTEMAKAAKGLKMNRMARFDMDQFKGEVDVNKLFGSSMGYVGSSDKALFAKTIDPFVHSSTKESDAIVNKVQNIVLLFDEFEKAHEEVKQGLLTLFGEGYVQVQHTDSESRSNIITRYVFNKSLFINTSNAYQEQIVKAFINKRPHTEIIELFTKLNKEDIRNSRRYSPELLGRLQIIPFNPIPESQFPQLVRRKLPTLLEDLHKKVGCKTLKVKEEDLDFIVEYLAKELYGDGTGMRRLLQYFDCTLFQIICEQANTWGNFKDLEMEIIRHGQELGIACKKTLYGEVLQEHTPVSVKRK